MPSKSPSGTTPFAAVKPYGRTTSRSGRFSFAALCPFCSSEGKRSTILATHEEPERTCPSCGRHVTVELPSS